ncbi:MAG TPA: EF-hand domain-containing protein [Lysobacter sp.]
MIARGKFSTRRKALLGLVLVLLAAVAWLHFTGAAATRGLERKQMDWNNDGEVTPREMLQSLYAVQVKVTHEGARECRAYSWRGSTETLRVDCRTSMQPAPAKP